MSHIEMIASGLPLDQQQHLTFVLRSLNRLQKNHAPRLRQTKRDRLLVAGDVWGNSVAARRATSSIPHNIVSTATALLLPGPPDITIIPLSQEDGAGRKADAVQRWLYALIEKVRALPRWQAQGQEMIVAGVGPMHVQPYKMALRGRQIPLLLDVPDADAVLYEIGPFDLPTTVFIKHKFTTAQIRQRFGVAMSQYAHDDDSEHECWCYYAEEVYPSASGEPLQLLVYGLLCGSRWIQPLENITSLFPGLPVQLAFNSEGYDWAGREEMRARGNLTHQQELLTMATDFLTQLALNQFKGLNPPMLVTGVEGRVPLTLDLTPGMQNNATSGEQVRALLEAQPTAQSFQFQQVLMQQIADGSIPQIFTPMQAIADVSGSAHAEQMHPYTVKNRLRQDALARSIAISCECMLRHMAARINPRQGMVLYGADPRDRSQISELLRPADLLEPITIDVRLPSQTPRNVYLMVQLLQSLAKEGIISMEVAAESIVKWLDLPVGDMSSMMAAAQADQIKKVQMQIAQQEAMKLLPMVRQEANNRHFNPDAHMDGSAPYQLGSQGMDPTLAAQAATPGPVQREAQANRAITQGGY
jgi:hypothetical protein